MFKLAKFVDRKPELASFVALLISLLLAAFLYLGLHNAQRQSEDVRTWQSKNVVRQIEWLWVSTKLNYRYVLFTQAVFDYKRGSSELTAEDILDEFDVFWSWFSSLDVFNESFFTDKNDAEYFSDSSRELISKIYALSSQLKSDGLVALEAAEPLIMSISSDNSTVDAIVQKFGPVIPVMVELQNSVMLLMRETTQVQETLSVRASKRLNLAYYCIGTAVFLLLFSIGYYFLRNTLRNHQLTRLNSELTALSDEKSLHVKQLDKLVHRDHATGVWNRTGFQREIEPLLLNGEEHGILFIDIDMFKAINDSVGQAGADALIQQVATALSENDKDSSNGRVKNDENFWLVRYSTSNFLVFRRNISSTDFEAFAFELNELFQPLRFQFQDRKFDVTSSIGAYHFHGRQKTLQQILNCVDAASSEAVQQGGGKLKFFDGNNALIKQRAADSQALELIRRGLEEGLFALYYQPIVTLTESGHQPWSYELLIRMIDDDGSPVPPADFLPTAERHGLMPKIDMWVSREALRWLERNDISVAGLHHISINLSGLSISDDEFVEELIELIGTYNVDYEQLCFEVTETAALTGSAIQNLHQLSELGISLSLDDFGSGFSSFSYLKDLPVSQIKIDGVFVKDLDTNEAHQEFVRAIASVAKAFGKSTVGEFVENEVSRKLLWELGVEAAQGYHIAKPEPLPTGFDRKGFVKAA